MPRAHRGSCDKRNGAAHVLRGVLDPKCEWPLRNSLIAQTKCNGKLGKISLLQRTHYTSTITLPYYMFDLDTKQEEIKPFVDHLNDPIQVEFCC